MSSNVAPLNAAITSLIEIIEKRYHNARKPTSTEKITTFRLLKIFFKSTNINTLRTWGDSNPRPTAYSAATLNLSMDKKCYDVGLGGCRAIQAALQVQQLEKK